MALSTAGTPAAFLPHQVAELVVRPVTAESVAIQAATLVQTGETSSFRVPIVAADPTAAWTAENAPITATDPTFTEVVTPYFKLAGLTVISNELANDSDPAALEVVGRGLARDIARKLDAAFFGTKGASTITPAGLGDLTGINEVAGPTAWTDVDPFLETIYDAEGVGASVGAFVANPADALALAQLKESTGSNRPLLQPDATQPTRRLLAGVPLLTSPGVAAGTVWGIPADRALIALRQDVALEVSTDAYFGSDQTAIRAILRVGFAFPHAAAIQKITLTP